MFSCIARSVRLQVRPNANSAEATSRSNAISACLKGSKSNATLELAYELPIASP